MDVVEYFKSYKTYPLIFAGTGLSLRYLEKSYTWDMLLKQCVLDIGLEERDFLKIKAKNMSDVGKIDYPSIGSEIEKIFNEHCDENDTEITKQLNEEYFYQLDKNIKVSRFKSYIAQLVETQKYRTEMNDEIELLQKASKNVAAFITTNYDTNLEKISGFSTLIGNDIILKNNYGVVYKIHGCVNSADKIVISKEDYLKFKENYDLIRAQLVTYFINNPIIFIGYELGDENIQSILETIFSYVDINSSEGNKIKNNFLIVEYEKGSTNELISDYDIELQTGISIKIKKLSTDNFRQVYDGLNQLSLPISVMDIRKVQGIIKDIEIDMESAIKVSIDTDVDNYKNSDKILYIGESKVLEYKHVKVIDYFKNYFSIIDENSKSVVNTIDQLTIGRNQHFPIFGFNKINNADNATIQELKTRQEKQVNASIEGITIPNEVTTIDDLINTTVIAKTYRYKYIMKSIMDNVISIDDAESYIRNNISQKYSDTSYKKILLAYDLKKYK